jgi:O-antigen/teichoic acid export membrane protein
LVVALGFLPINFFHEKRIVLLLFGIAIVSSQILGYFTVLSRLHENFLLLSLGTIIGSGVSLLGTLLVCIYIESFKTTWLVLAWISNLFISGFILFIFLPKLKWEFRLNKEVIFKLIRFGWLPSLLPFGTLLFQSVDRWTFASMTSRTTFGYYSLGTTIAITLSIIPQSLISPITKKLNKLIYSEKQNVSTMIDFMLGIIAGCQSLIGGILILTLPYLVNLLFPQYKEGVTTISILTFAAIMLFPISTVYEAHISLNKVKSLISIIFFFVGIEALFVYIGGHFFSLTGAAIGVTSSNFCFGVFASTKTLMISGLSSSQAILKTFKSYLFVFLTLLLAISLRYTEDNSLHFFKTALMSCLFIVLMAPIFYYFLRPKFLNTEVIHGTYPS